jgi:hypothetical protein
MSQATNEYDEDDRAIARILREAQRLGVKLHLTFTAPPDPQRRRAPEDRARLTQFRRDLKLSNGPLLGRLIVWGPRALEQLEPLLRGGSSTTEYIDQHADRSWPEL